MTDLVDPDDVCVVCGAIRPLIVVCGHPHCPLREPLVTAWVTHDDPIYNGQQIAFSTGHEIQFGGAGGDGFCYAHQSFKCVDELTDQERAALHNAKELPVEGGGS